MKKLAVFSCRCLTGQVKKKKIRLISWNVNGIRSCLDKGLLEFINREQPDIMALQEVRALPDQVTFAPEGYEIHWNPAEKKGYSGTMILSRQKILSLHRGIGKEEHDTEGRVIRAEFENFQLINVYTPNSGPELARLGYREDWDREFKDYCRKSSDAKPALICGDLNVAHKEIDLTNPEKNRKSAGFTDQERAGFENLLNAGFTDTFRHFFPDTPEKYTWWSYKFQARQKNIGWRIDYFLADGPLIKNLKSASILDSVYGSDHCPVETVLEF